MADTNVSAVLSFVKKYPITLCGFSLLFMPSVHRLLLFFTPLLLSTALFIVAIFIWGPNTASSSERSAIKRNVLIKIDHDELWTTNGLKDVIVGKAINLEMGGGTNCSAQLDEYSDLDDPDLKLKPDPDLHVETADDANVHDAELYVEPDPDLHAGHAERPDPDQTLLAAHVEPHRVEADPDLHVEHVEPDPDLHELEHVAAEPDPDLAREDKTAPNRDGHHNSLFAKAVERELAGLEASLSSSLNRSSSAGEDETQDHHDKVGRKAGFPHQKAVLQALKAAA